MEQIGQEGKSINASHATRALNLEPNRALLKKYDMYAAKSDSASKKWLVAAVVSLAGTIGLFATGHWIWGIALLLLTAVFGFLFLMFRGLAIGGPYASGLLVPAVVVSAGPIKIAALAPMNRTETENDTSDYGLKLLTIPHLPMHTLTIGNRVPCVAMFSAGSRNGLYTNFEPRPVSWGFDDENVIKKAIDVIDEDEWTFLDTVKHVVTEMSDDQVAYFDASHTLIEVR